MPGSLSAAALPVDSKICGMGFSVCGFTPARLQSMQIFGRCED